MYILYTYLLYHGFIPVDPWACFNLFLRKLLKESQSTGTDPVLSLPRFERKGCWSNSRMLVPFSYDSSVSPQNLINSLNSTYIYSNRSNTHTQLLLALCLGLPRWARKVKPIWILLKQEWQWHQLGHMQVCTLLQTDNHASTPPLRFLQARCPFCHPTNRVKALKATPS